MNDYILRKFELLKRNIDNLRNPFQRDKIRVQIEELFENIFEEKTKKEIIVLFKGKLDKGLEEHKKTCMALNNDCVIEGNYESAHFFLDQELEKVRKDSTSSFKNYIENLTISGSGNLVNIGGINGNIENNISFLKDSGEQKIAEAFERIKEIVNNEEMPEVERELLLDNVNTLSTQATLERSQRLPLNVIKTIFSGINVLSSISTVAGIDLQSIFSYFTQ